MYHLGGEKITENNRPCVEIDCFLETGKYATDQKTTGNTEKHGMMMTHYKQLIEGLPDDCFHGSPQVRGMMLTRMYYP